MRETMNKDQELNMEGKASKPEVVKMMDNMTKCRDGKFTVKITRGVNYDKDKYEDMSDKEKVENLQSTDV